MREWIGKHKAEAFGAAALAVIAAVCIIRMLQPVKVWEFGEDQLERMGEAIHFDANVIDGNASGWYVDNSLEYGEVFVQTPAVDLPAGSYDVTIRYQGEGSGSTYEFTSTADTYRVMLGRNGMPLESGKRGENAGILLFSASRRIFDKNQIWWRRIFNFKRDRNSPDAGAGKDGSFQYPDSSGDLGFLEKSRKADKYQKHVPLGNWNWPGGDDPPYDAIFTRCS